MSARAVEVALQVALRVVEVLAAQGQVVVRAGVPVGGFRRVALPAW